MTVLLQDFLSGNLGSTLAAGASGAVTDSSFAGLPAVTGSDTLKLVLDPDGTAGDPEIITITAHTASSTTATISRASEGTTARQHLSSTKWVNAVTTADFNRLGFDGTIAADLTGNVTGDVTGDVAGAVIATTLTASQDANFDSGTLFVDVSTNRVGIGDTTPGYKLDVAGEIRATGNIRGNQLLIGSTDDGLQSVTGDYGSVQTAGSGAGGYEGYSIAGHAVFMSSNSTSAYGLYDDANSNWGIACDRSGATNLYYDGSTKLSTTNTGATVTGTLTAGTFSGSGASLSNLNGSSISSGTVDKDYIDTDIARKSEVYGFGSGSSATYNITTGSGSGTPSTAVHPSPIDGDIHIWY